MDSDTPNDPMQGVVYLGDGITPVDIWQGLHANARAWEDVPYGASQDQDRLLIDGTDLGVLRALSDYPAEQWSAFCAAVGWTVYGVVGLSWCSGAKFEDIAAIWKDHEFPVTADDHLKRPARLINLAIVPETNSLTSLIKSVGNNLTSTCILIAIKGKHLDVDVSDKTIQGAAPQIAALLAGRK